MRHDLCPGFVKIHYARPACSHTQVIGVNYDGIPTPGSDPTLVCKNATTVLGSTGVAAYVAQAKKLFNAEMVFSSWEFWYKATSDSEPTWIHDGVFVGTTGTFGGGTNVAGEGILTFRTADHGLLRLYFMETGFGANEKKLPTTFGGATQIQDVYNYCIGATTWLYGRDNSYPINATAWVSKVNDILRKKLLVP